jgi:DNA-binding MarR family transcriptional regulator/GNAT superfamily N-acetyltransferase
MHAVRRFNRFYSRRPGLFGEGWTDGSCSLTEARILTELARRDQPTAAEIAKDLDLDAGYLSRILLRFQKLGWIAREPSAIDRRQHHIVLTRSGRQALKPPDRGDAAAGLAGNLSGPDQNRLIGAMETIECLLGERPSGAEYLIRTHRPGDVAWVMHRHAVLYAEQYGGDARFEAIVAAIGAAFLESFDASRERCWIAERQGRIAGAICIVNASDDTAKLRLLLVEPEARGLGIGKRLVAECIAFARECGYRKIALWTTSDLLAARRIYQGAGFQLVSEEPNSEFGSDLVSQRWELTL